MATHLPSRGAIHFVWSFCSSQATLPRVTRPPFSCRMREVLYLPPPLLPPPCRPPVGAARRRFSSLDAASVLPPRSSKYAAMRRAGEALGRASSAWLTSCCAWGSLSWATIATARLQYSVLYHTQAARQHNAVDRKSPQVLDECSSTTGESVGGSHHLECCETQSPENTVNCGAEGPPCGIVPAAPGAVP
eukprot:COSAG04_NODE_6240_length_1376_cov_1.193422_1_plen_189_part_10